MFVLIVYNKGSCKDPITVGMPTLESTILEIAKIEYINLKNKNKLTYILYNGYSMIIAANGEATEQGEYIRFKGQEQAKEKSRLELIKQLEESKACLSQKKVVVEEKVVAEEIAPVKTKKRSRKKI